MRCGNCRDGSVEIYTILGGDRAGAVGDWWKRCGGPNVEGLEAKLEN